MCLTTATVIIQFNILHVNQKRPNLLSENVVVSFFIMCVYVCVSVCVNKCQVLSLSDYVYLNHSGCLTHPTAVNRLSELHCSKVHISGMLIESIL